MNRHKSDIERSTRTQAGRQPYPAGFAERGKKRPDGNHARSLGNSWNGGSGLLDFTLPPTRLVTQAASNVMDPMMRIILSVFLAAFLIATTSQAQEPRVQRGRTFARTHCASCHAIGNVGESPLRIAPPFRTLHLRYPVEDLAESLAEGIMTAHRDMPQFQLDKGQIADLIAYLKSLER